MNRTSAFLLRRLLFIPLSLFVVVTASFGLVYLMPGDPAITILGSFATPDEVEKIHHALGTDRPFFSRYGHYLYRLVHGDLGSSFFSGRPVRSEIASYVPNSLELVVLSLLLAAVLGIALGAVAAWFRRRAPDRVSRTVVTAMQSTPEFLLALVLIYALFFVAHVAPAPTGRLAITDSRPPDYTGFLLLDTLLAGDLGLFWSGLQHIFLPVLTLGVINAAAFAKVVRSSMGRALAAPYIQFARACGLSRWLILRYALLAARTIILTYGAILFGTLVGGAAIVETIFAWQGLGQWALNGMLKVDVPVIQGFILFAGLGTLVVYLVLDLIVYALDPRISYG